MVASGGPEDPIPLLPAHRTAVEGESGFRKLVGELTGRLGVDEPAGLADQLMLVMEGLFASGRSLGPDGPAKQARHPVEMILSTATARRRKS
ncbi:hypothetical protein [Nonomuraea sp. NPDC049709]|uniref:hypothetical protein n=1 Tax=Nonomuraea sp. NPDC049709 TaxID=3154736 RepID=UPI00341941EF